MLLAGCALPGCLDACKPDARLHLHVNRWLSTFAPTAVIAALNSRVVRFTAILLCVGLLNAAFLALIYTHLKPVDEAGVALLETTIWMLFYALMIISGVVSWLILLAHESRLVAQQESNRQTRLLVDEIEAHNETDRALQEAKEQAERANAAKSRYLSGISHELRTPLQSILGYAQLLCSRSDMPAQHHNGLNIIRNSGEYLAGLIEGLLDISKIEAGRLDIYRNQVHLPDLLTQLVEVFRQQAQLKGIDLHYHLHNRLPHVVMTDEKRLRQILINLLSNAIKYTAKGRVDFHVYYRNQVAEFAVMDTGIGIASGDLERIFTPFERLRNQHNSHIPGTGLGLTIVQLLTDIMGGRLSVKSTPGKGSCFSVTMMLSWVASSELHNLPSRIIRGYRGQPRTLMVVDDEPLHRGLMNDLLTPLGFTVIEAHNGTHCLQQLKLLQQDQSMPDAFILDVNMPDLNGLDLCVMLRQKGVQAPIIMLSAEATEPRNSHPSMPRSSGSEQPCPYNDYLVKPIRNPLLLDKLAQVMQLEWLYWSDGEHNSEPTDGDDNLEVSLPLPTHPLLDKLLQRVQVGHRKGVLDALEDIRSAGVLNDPTLRHLAKYAQALRYDELELLLEATAP